jgi:tetratricopeptide (TPR) repeat protein
MPGRRRIVTRLRIGLLLVVAVHAAAIWMWPGHAWGASQLAVWPSMMALAVLAAAMLVLLMPPTSRGVPWPFPSRRGALLLALGAGAVFWLCREGSHFFGDGYLLIRSRGMSTTVLRAPVLVRTIVWIVRTLEDHAGVRMDTALASVSVAAGMLSVYLGLRLCAALDARRAVRWLVATLLGTSGAMQLFFGHVEYYAALVPAVLGYFLIAVHALHGRAPWWAAWIGFALLPTVHLSTLALAPAQAWLAVTAWRRGMKRATWLGAAGAALVAIVLLRLIGSGADRLAAESAGGFKHYLQPFFDRASSRHAFGFASPAHGLALLNDLLLVAPLALGALPAVLDRRKSDAVGHFLALATGGCVALSILFNREVGPYRDWNILAPYAFIGLAWIGVRLAASPMALVPTMTRMLAVVGLMHTVPWIATNHVPVRALSHLRLVLAAPTGWSPYARGYMHEELAIRARDRGDLTEARREYEAAVAANPSDARYHVGLGDMSFRLGDHGRAIEEYETALRSRPDFMPAHNNLAAVLSAKGLEPERALRHAAAAVQLAPDNYDAQLTYSGALQASRRFSEARAALERARSLRPQSARELDPRIEMLRRMELEPR